MGGGTVMTLKELKDCVTNNVVPSDFMIFIRKDNNFLASQYVQALCKLAEGGITKISSIYEPQQSSLALLTAQEGTLNILTVETFDERAENYNQFENTIVVCDQVDKSIANSVESFIIKFPELEEWQILDYAKMLCPSVAEEDLLWLIKATNNNIERILNELDKVSLFSKEEQKVIFSSIRFDPQLDLYKADLFTVADALVDGNILVLREFLKYSGYNDLEPVVLANRALSKLKNIIIVTQNPLLNAENCGISAGYYKHLMNNYRSLNIEAMKQKIKFLTNFDLKLKTSKLELDKREMFNYLANNLAYKITL